MIEDKLTRSERLRLEALNQANKMWVMKPANVENILTTAKQFEEYIRGTGHD